MCLIRRLVADPVAFYCLQSQMFYRRSCNSAVHIAPFGDKNNTIYAWSISHPCPSRWFMCVSVYSNAGFSWDIFTCWQLVKGWRGEWLPTASLYYTHHSSFPPTSTALVSTAGAASILSSLRVMFLAARARITSAFASSTASASATLHPAGQGLNGPPHCWHPVMHWLVSQSSVVTLR